MKESGQKLQCLILGVVNGLKVVLRTQSRDLLTFIIVTSLVHHLLLKDRLKGDHQLGDVELHDLVLDFLV